ncbi:hypothetical protein BBF96_06320 [Anoxybacter fermentans]|uniref:Uncharacterized protein n=2 Tax=Anoxybacter fermentans TaxID=1323375 RepID=A0A3Q9HPY0_9FIRM|nr:hypothetical protein BBF96_06320 [Anoxybacter fermentans]
MGITPSDIVEIMANLEDTLERYGIQIYPVDKELTDERVEGFDYEKIMKYKTKSYFFYSYSFYNHDLFAIEIIKKIRGKEVSKLEKVKAIFLTSDSKLAQYNFIENGHQKRFTISEVILDQLLTNVLWFKNPINNSNLPLHAVISMYANTLFVDDDLGIKFVKKLKKMKEENKLTDDDISIIFYNARVEEELLNLEGRMDIDEDFIDKIVQKAKVNYEEREDVFRLQQEENEILKRKNKEVLTYINSIKDRIDNDARKKAEVCFMAIKCTVIILLAVVIILSLNRVISLNIYIQCFIGLCSLLGIRFNFFDNLKIKLYEIFIKKLNKKYLEEGEGYLSQQEVATGKEE